MSQKILKKIKKKPVKGKTPQMFRVPQNFSLWIAFIIAFILFLLILAGQIGPTPENEQTTLQLPSQQAKPILLPDDNTQYNFKN